MSMRDLQILFQPYNQEDIESIVEEKQNSKLHKCVPSMELCKGSQQKTEARAFLKDVFFELIEEKALKYLSKKIS